MSFYEGYGFPISITERPECKIRQYCLMAQQIDKNEVIDELTSEIEPIIKGVLAEYLEYIPEDVEQNISKEIKSKIQDSLFGFDSNLS